MEIIDSLYLRNKKNVSKLLSTFDILSNVEVIFSQEDPDFYKINYRHQNSEKCPFSIWIQKITGERIFFNIGEQDKEAVVSHYSDISSQDGLEGVVEHINLFLISEVLEEKLYCRDRLKRVAYKLINRNYGELKYSFLNESYFICVRKSIVQNLFMRWVQN